MDVFLMIRRKKTTIFMDCKENSTVLELKKMIGGITKVAPEDQRLFKELQPMEDSKTLADCGYTSTAARAQSPAVIGLAFRKEGGDFEELEIDPYSSPPELPDVMKPGQEASPAPEARTA